MKNANTSHTLVSIFFIIAFLSGSIYFKSLADKPLLVVSKQDSTLNLDYKIWEFFNIGQKRLISSLMWISTILESDVDHYKKRDLNSWMFIRFQTISMLEPMFYENYAFGGPYLSIVKDDLPGASIIYDKGLSLYPNDFSLLRDAGFHYYFELGDYDKSYPIYRKLRSFKNVSPSMIATMARLESHEGRLKDAFEILLTRYNTIEDKNSAIAKKIFYYLYSIKSEMDLECLNTKDSKEKCEQIDLEGNPYIFENNIYRASKPWTPFRTKRKK